MKAMQAGAANGTWVLLQNCELGLDLMVIMEEFLEKLREGQDPNFRLFITGIYIYVYIYIYIYVYNIYTYIPR
jgi:dynein heavy chain